MGVFFSGYASKASADPEGREAVGPNPPGKSQVAIFFRPPMQELTLHLLHQLSVAFLPGILRPLAIL